MSKDIVYLERLADETLDNAVPYIIGCGMETIFVLKLVQACYGLNRYVADNQHERIKEQIDAINKMLADTDIKNEPNNRRYSGAYEIRHKSVEEKLNGFKNDLESLKDEIEKHRKVILKRVSSKILLKQDNQEARTVRGTISQTLEKNILNQSGNFTQSSITKLGYVYSSVSRVLSKLKKEGKIVGTGVPNEYKVVRGRTDSKS